MAVAIEKTEERRSAAEARFEALVLDFLAHLEFERGRARTPLPAYRTDLLQYGSFLTKRHRGATEAERADVADFLADLATGNGHSACSPATINRKAACLRSFYRHLRREELIDDDPTAGLAPPSKSRKLPRVLSYAEVKRLLESVNGGDAIALRDRAMLEIMYGCGLRASEAVGLDVNDVDLRRGFVRPHGKGNKERTVPLGREAAAAVKPYLRAGRPQLEGSLPRPEPFLNFRGGPLTPQRPCQVIHDHAKDAGPIRPI